MVLKMVVYIDLLILSTVFVNYIFIKTIAIIFKEKLLIFRTMIALMLSVLMLLLYFIPYNIFFVIRYFMGIIIGIVAFKSKSIKTKIIKIAIFYILNMSFIGTLVVFNVKSIIPFIITLFYIVVLYIVQHYVTKLNEKNIYNIKINNDKLEGYYDTGNTACYKNIPIVFIKRKYFNKNYKYIDKIHINTIIGNSEIYIYLGPKIIINNIEYEVFYGFVDNIEFDVILNIFMRGIK